MVILDYLFPKSCLGCGQNGAYICNRCVGTTDICRPVCPNCEKASVDGMTHTKCFKKYGLDGVSCIWKYGGVIRKALLTLKYRRAQKISEELAGCAAGIINAKIVRIPEYEFLSAVPMFWYKENLRGFNQAEILAEIIAQKTGLVKSDLLLKLFPTAPQVELTHKERKKNLGGVFEVGKSFDKNNFQSVILLDDVFTTGSTLREACLTLKKAGVLRVWGLCLAR